MLPEMCPTKRPLSYKHPKNRPPHQTPKEHPPSPPQLVHPPRNESRWFLFRSASSGRSGVTRRRNPSPRTVLFLARRRELPIRRPTRETWLQCRSASRVKTRTTALDSDLPESARTVLRPAC